MTDHRKNAISLPSLGANISGLNQEGLSQIDQFMGHVADMSAFEPPKLGYVTVGIIAAVLPFSNMCLIHIGGSGNEKKPTLVSYSGSNRLNGSVSVNYLLPGTYVIVHVRGTQSDVKLPPYTILGTIDPFGLDDNMRHVFDKPSEFLSHSGTPASTSIETELNQATFKNSLQATNFNYGKPMDGIPGEQYFYNAFGGGLMISDFMTVMKGSEAARIELYTFDDTVKVISGQFIHQNDMYDQRMFYSRYGLSRITGMAMTLPEGLGSLDGTTRLMDAPTVDDAEQDRIHRTDDTAIGYFNINKVEGSLGDGIYEYITYPPDGTILKGDSVIPPGLLSIEKTYDGSFRVKAAREVSLQKTMYIVAPKEISPSNSNSKEEGEDVREDWDAQHTSIEELSFLGKQFTGTWEEFQREHSLGDMRVEKDFWIVPNKEQVYQAFNEATGASFEPEESLNTLPEDEPHYSEPARQTTIRPFTVDGMREKEFTIYDTSSGIRQLPDGSVVIYGGNGEEIKMYKGNIYLTCPGDIIVQPGRDMITMAPRNNIAKAGKGTLELTSGNSASLTAGGNLQICAASSGVGSGTLVIENKSLLDLDLEAFEENKGFNANTATGGGIFIKSNSRTALINPQTYIGCGNNPAGSTFELDVENSEFHTFNHKHYVANLHSTMNKLGAALTIGGGAIEMLAAQIQSGTANFNIIKTSKKIPYYDRTGKKENVSVTASNTLIQVRGDFLLSGALEASNLSSTGGDVGDNTKYHPRNVAVIPTEANQYTVDNIFVGSLARILEMQQASLEDLDKISVIMPSTAAYKAAKFYFPFSTWQSILTGSSVWSEPVINGWFRSMAFPGLDRWKESGSLKGLKDNEIEDKVLDTEYKVNY